MLKGLLSATVLTSCALFLRADSGVSGLPGADFAAAPADSASAASASTTVALPAPVPAFPQECWGCISSAVTDTSITGLCFPVTPGNPRSGTCVDPDPCTGTNCVISGTLEIYNGTGQTLWYTVNSSGIYTALQEGESAYESWVNCRVDCGDAIQVSVVDADSPSGSIVGYYLFN